MPRGGAPSSDAAAMTYDAGDETNNDEEGGEHINADGAAPSSQLLPSSTRTSQEEAELEAFLSSTDLIGIGGDIHQNRNPVGDESDEEEEECKSDGGTRYVKDPRTGNFVHEDLAPPPPPKHKSKRHPTPHGNGNENEESAAEGGGKKRKKGGNKSKFRARNARCWIYVTCLPADTCEEESRYMTLPPPWHGASFMHYSSAPKACGIIDSSLFPP